MEEGDKSLLDVREMSLKCTSKREVYKVLSITGNVYLPPESQINSDFISDILSGDKLFLTGDQVKIINVPHIEGLRIPDILSFAGEYVDINKYMPEYDTERYPSRNWICNIVNSLIQNEFQKFINTKICENNSKIDTKKGNKFPVLPVFAKVFEQTNLVSKSHGRFHQLVKNSKKKRIERFERIKKQDEHEVFHGLIKEQEKEIADLKNKIYNYEKNIEEHEKDADLLHSLYQKGYIDLDGNPIER